MGETSRTRKAGADVPRCGLASCRRRLDPALAETDDRLDDMYCSPRCLARAVGQLPLQSCPVCRSSRRIGKSTGRPRTYCSDRCRKQRETDIAQAMRELARDEPPPNDEAAARQMLARAEMLAAYWYGGERSSRLFSGVNVSDLRRRHWAYNNPPTPTKRPPAAAQQPLYRRVARLREAVTVIRNPGRGQDIERLWARAAARDDAGPGVLEFDGKAAERRRARKAEKAALRELDKETVDAEGSCWPAGR